LVDKFIGSNPSGGDGKSKEEVMAHSLKMAVSLAAALVLAAGYASAQDRHDTGHPQPVAHAAEPHAGPKGYSRVAPPSGWNKRPATVDRTSYQHNYQAARHYSIGPYHPPAGWTSHRWSYGEILPRAYWASEYILADYWLFALEVPPVGYEWVRDGDDALLVNIDTGEILQVEYGVFG
jgi:Ni/Co efflux regulator RcnB